MRKKIFHVTFDMRIGGAEQVILNIVENTDTEKFDVQVICLETEVGPFGKQLRKKGYRIHTCNRQPGFDFSLVAAIRSLIKEEKIDVLHCHQYTPFVYGVLASVATPCKVIFTEHGRFFPDIRKPKRILVNPLLSLLTDKITAISKATKLALIKYENFPAHKIGVIYNGIDDTRFIAAESSGLRRKLGLPEDSFVMGTVARLDPIKNQPLMIRALNKIRQKFPSTYLLFVGDGPERRNLEQLTRKLGLEAHVIFTGFKEDTQHYYKLMDLFLLTSFSEGTAMTLLEAMASSLPCIATNVGGNPEIVLDRETGRIIPNDDVEKLTDAILQLLEKPELKKQLGNKGRKRFENHFSASKMTDAYQDLYIS